MVDCPVVAYTAHESPTFDAAYSNGSNFEDHVPSTTNNVIPYWDNWRATALTTDTFSGASHIN